MLSVQQVFKNFGGQSVLEGVSFQLNDRERTGLIGVNGGGKSTLLKIIMGDIELDRGAVATTPGTRVAYLAQDSQVLPGRTLQHEMESAHEELLRIVEEQEATTAKIGALLPDDPQLTPLVEHQADLLHDFERLGGYTLEAEIGRVLHGLGFNDADRSRGTGEFSGGWQMRIALAKLLLQAPDILLLDEPTNHLDVQAVEWLEEYLRAYRGSVLLVSHDRYVLDRVTTRTLELDRGSVTSWPGNYSWYVAEKARQQAEQEAAYQRQKEFIEQQRVFIERFRAKPSKTTAVQSREKFLEKLENPEAYRGKRTAKHQFVTAPTKARRGIKFRFPECPPSGRETLSLRRVAKAYGALRVLKQVDLLIERGDRVALVGPNGAGKSTLLRIMAGVDRPDKGSVHFGHNARPSYFAQHQAEILDHTHTVMDEVYTSAPPSWTELDVRNLLGRFLFSNEDVFKRIGVLSGGERSRVALAKMLLRPANLMLLDEPTNHLDILGREVLQESLEDFPGTFVIVSHDRYLIDRVATKIVDIDDGETRLYIGNYTEYREQKAVRARSAPIVMAAPSESELGKRGEQRHQRSAEQPGARGTVSSKAQEQDGRRKSDTSSKQTSMFSQRKLDQIEAMIMALEEQKATLESDMANPDVYRESERWPTLLAEFEDVNGRLDELNRQWNQMAMRAAEASAATAIARSR